MTTRYLGFINDEYCKLTKAAMFEARHREWLEKHDGDYTIIDPNRLCFLSDSGNDIGEYFGHQGWTMEVNGFVKEVMGIEIKVYGEGEGLSALKGAVDLPKNFLKPSIAAHLDEIESSESTFTNL